jgi:hypothetical protein
MRCTRGQASIEWIVVIGVVTVALSVAGAAAGAPQIAGVVVRQFDRALCIVSRGDCNEDRAPCVTMSDTHKEDASLTVLIVKHDDSTQVLMERRSDGTWLVTRLHESGTGFDVGVGGQLTLSGLGLELGMGGEAQGWVLAHEGASASYLAHSEVQARSLAAELSLHIHPKAKPAQVYVQSGTQTNLQGSLAKGLGTVGLQYTQDNIDGTRVNADGDVTTYVRQRADGSASLEVAKALLGGTLQGMHSTEYGVTTDPTGRPSDLDVISVGQSALGFGLPGLTQRQRALATITHAQGASWQLDQHLDLTDPDNRAAAMAFMKAIENPDENLGGLAMATAALSARLAVDGTDQASAYDLKQNVMDASGSVALGVKVGGSYNETSTKMKLVDAEVRGPDGIWTDRDDCVKEA